MVSVGPMLHWRFVLSLSRDLRFVVEIRAHEPTIPNELRLYRNEQAVASKQFVR